MNMKGTFVIVADPERGNCQPLTALSTQRERLG
jgi:hypothetical protein